MAKITAQSFQDAFNKVVSESPFSKVASESNKSSKSSKSSKEDVRVAKDHELDHFLKSLEEDVELADAPLPPQTNGTNDPTKNPAQPQPAPGSTSGPTPATPTTSTQETHKTASFIDVLVRASAICDSFGVGTVATQVLKVAAAMAKKLPKTKKQEKEEKAKKEKEDKAKKEEKSKKDMSKKKDMKSKKAYASHEDVVALQHCVDDILGKDKCIVTGVENGVAHIHCDCNDAELERICHVLESKENQNKIKLCVYDLHEIVVTDSSHNSVHIRLNSELSDHDHLDMHHSSFEDEMLGDNSSHVGLESHDGLDPLKSSFQLELMKIEAAARKGKKSSSKKSKSEKSKSEKSKSEKSKSEKIKLEKEEKAKKDMKKKSASAPANYKMEVAQIFSDAKLPECHIELATNNELGVSGGDSRNDYKPYKDALDRATTIDGLVKVMFDGGSVWYPQQKHGSRFSKLANISPNKLMTIRAIIPPLFELGGGTAPSEMSISNGNAISCSGFDLKNEKPFTTKMSILALNTASPKPQGKAYLAKLIECGCEELVVTDGQTSETWTIPQQ